MGNAAPDDCGLLGLDFVTVDEEDEVEGALPGITLADIPEADTL